MDNFEDIIFIFSSSRLLSRDSLITYTQQEKKKCKLQLEICDFRLQSVQNIKFHLTVSSTCVIQKSSVFTYKVEYIELVLNSEICQSIKHVLLASTVEQVQLAQLLSQRSWVRIPFKPNIFFMLFFNCLNWVHNYDDLLFVKIVKTVEQVMSSYYVWTHKKVFFYRHHKRRKKPEDAMQRCLCVEPSFTNQSKWRHGSKLTSFSWRRLKSWPFNAFGTNLQ